MNKELAETCLRYLDGDLSADELRSFGRLLVESPEAAKMLAELAMDEQHFRVTPAEAEDDLLPFLLHQESLAIPMPLARPSLDPDAAVEKTPTYQGALKVLADPEFLGYLATSLLRSRPGKWLAAAAVVAIAATLLFVLIPSNNPGTSPLAGQNNGLETEIESPASASPAIVATLTAEHDAVWDRRPGQDLYAGQKFTLTQGFAEITTHRGAVAIIEAPAAIELVDSDNAIRLHTGKLVGLCHTEFSKGFVVKTDHAEITDLGTEFGVSATAERTEATVFVGEVAIRAGDSPKRVITHSQTARVTAGDFDTSPSIMIEDAPADTAAYTQRMPRTALITSASINLPGFKVEVVPNGVYEDAKLFTDREHELNGVDSLGLPTQLLGGDLVKTASDARPGITQDAENLEIQIELDRAAEIYILYKSQVTAPDWLQRDFERTALKTGFDRAPQFEGDRSQLGQGPGVSIDAVSDVWKRKQPATGTVVFGSMSSQSAYNVIAVPIGENEPQ